MCGGWIASVIALHASSTLLPAGSCFAAERSARNARGREDATSAPRIHRTQLLRKSLPDGTRRFSNVSGCAVRRGRAGNIGGRPGNDRRETWTLRHHRRHPRLPRRGASAASARLTGAGTPRRGGFGTRDRRAIFVGDMVTVAPTARRAAPRADMVATARTLRAGQPRVSG